MKSLIVARSGAIQEALTTILSSIPQVKNLGVAENRLTALEMIRLHQPELVIVDDNFAEGETLDLVQHLKETWQQINVIVLADRFQQQQALLEGGADAVLLRGIPTEQITKTINTIHLSRTINQNSYTGVKKSD